MDELFSSPFSLNSSMRIKDILNESQPKKYWHGSIDKFDITQAAPLTHFGSKMAAAHRIHTKRAAVSMGTPRSLTVGYLYPVHLNINNPLKIIDKPEFIHSPYALVDMLHYDLKVITATERSSIQQQKCSEESIISLLSSKGYDGFVYQNEVEDVGHLSYVIFNSSQVSPAGNPEVYTKMGAYDKLSINEQWVGNHKAFEHNVDVFKNPSKTEFKKLLHNSKNYCLRALISDGDLYVWDAYYAVHGDMEQYYPNTGGSYLYLADDVTMNDIHLDYDEEGDGEKLYGPYLYKALQQVVNNPGLKNIYGNFVPLGTDNNDGETYALTPEWLKNNCRTGNINEQALNEIVLIPDLPDDSNEDRRKYSWDQMFQGAKKVTNLGGVQLWERKLPDGSYYFFLDRKGAKLGKATVQNIGTETIKVAHIWFHPAMRGMGVGYQFYLYLINTGIRVLADQDHTRFSKGVWQKLAKNGYVYEYSLMGNIGKQITDTEEFYGDRRRFMIAKKK